MLVDWSTILPQAHASYSRLDHELVAPPAWEGEVPSVVWNPAADVAELVLPDGSVIDIEWHQPTYVITHFGGDFKLLDCINCREVDDVIRTVRKLASK